MNAYEENIKYLKECRPAIYQKLESWKQDHKSTGISVSKEQSRDGHNSLLVTKDNKTYRMNSSYQPVSEAKKWVSQFELLDLKVVISMFGLGNGYFARELIGKLRDKDILIVVEPSLDIFSYIIKEFSIADIIMDQRVVLVLMEESEFSFKTVIAQYVHWMNAQSQVVCIHPQYEKCFKEKKDKFVLTISENNNRVYINRNTESYFGKSFIENTLHNFKYIIGSNTLAEYIGCLSKDIPAIIVAAGPSLDLNIDLLHEAKGKAVIVATDTALRILHKKGIQADIAVTLDPRKPPDYFDNTGFEEMPLFCEVQANHLALVKHSGRKVWFNCHDFMSQIYQRLNRSISVYNTGGSVATAAFSVCCTLGFKQIILIGQDLAYKGDITHAGGEICHVQSEEKGISYVEGIDGTQLKTRHDWHLFLQWFESAIYEHPEVEVIDATEGGARIHGSRLLTLREVIDSYCTKAIDFRSILESISPTFSTQELENVQDYLKQAAEDLSDTGRSVREVVRLCDLAIMEYKRRHRVTDEIGRLGKKIVKANAELVKMPVFSLTNDLIKHTSVKELQQISKFSADESENTISTFNQTKNIYTAMLNAVEELKQPLHDTLEEFSEQLEIWRNQQNDGQ